MTTLILIRHARSEGNVLGVCSGNNDYALVERGFVQAENLAAYLHSHYPITAIYSSNLKRCVQTATPTAKAFGLPIISDARLCEVCVGEWQGQNWDDLMSRETELCQAWLAMRMHRSDPRPKGAECYEEVVERMTSVFKQIVCEHRGECVAVFSHAKALRIMTEEWRRVCPVADTFLIEKKGFAGASCTVVEFDDDGNFLHMVLGGYNEYLKQDDRAVAVE